MRNAYELLLENLKGRHRVVDLSVDGKIILEWILWQEGGKMWIGIIWFCTGTSGGLL